jgi:hypothetical protein
MYATCFGLYLGHPQACQYKNLKEDTVKSKGPFFTVTVLFLILKQNIKV